MKLLTQKQIAGIKKKIDDHTAEVAKARDSIRELIDELTDLAETCERAHEYLECAADALSELA